MSHGVFSSWFLLKLFHSALMCVKPNSETQLCKKTWVPALLFPIFTLFYIYLLRLSGGRSLASTAPLCVPSGPTYLNCCTAIPESVEDSPWCNFRSSCAGLIAQSHKEEHSCSLCTCSAVVWSLSQASSAHWSGTMTASTCLGFFPFL